MKSNVYIPFKDTNHGIGKSDPWVSYHLGSVCVSYA